MQFYTNFFSFGHKLFVRGYTESGIQAFAEHDIKPTLYTPTMPNTHVETPGEAEQFSMYGDRVYPVKFDSPRDARAFQKTYADSGMKIWGYPRFDYATINELFPGTITYQADMIRTMGIDIETAVSDGFPSIFTTDDEILLITVSFKGKYYTYGARGYNRKSEPDESEIYIECKSEADLLKAFLMFVDKLKPDVITGWNIAGFDMPYLYNRIERVLGSGAIKQMSPFGKTDIRSDNFNGRESLAVEIYGVMILDYLELYKKFELSPRENYRLDTIAEIELGERKLEYECTFKELYEKHWDDKFVPYNVQDVRLIDRLDAKLGFILLGFSIAMTSKCNTVDVFRVTRVWDNIIANFLADQNKHVVADYRHFSDGYEGALVKDTIPGLYEWCITYDIGSLYPSIIRGHNMSPETILPTSTFHDIRPYDMIHNTDAYKVAYADAVSRNATLAANGSMYSKDKRGFLPQLIEIFVARRKAAQKVQREHGIKAETAKAVYAARFVTMTGDTGSDEIYTMSEHELKGYIAKMSEIEHLYDKEQHAIKILLNSVYGAMGTQYFRHYNVNIAEGITLTGQATVTQSFEMFNGYLNKALKTDTDYVVASDTDSCMINLTNFVNEIIPLDDDFETRLNKVMKITDDHFGPMLNKLFDRFAIHTNAASNTISMDREGITSACFVAKKNYVMKVYDNEGTRFAIPKQKITGLEAIKSSTPKYFREKLKEGYMYVFDKTEEDVHKFVEDVKAEYMNLPIEEIAGTSSVNEIVKYLDDDYPLGYIPTTPTAVRGSLAYNRLLDEHGLAGKYEKIRPGDKVKIVPLTKHNPVNLKFFCYLDRYPHEIMPERFIDREGNYGRYFVTPYERVIGVVNWSAEFEPSLDDFFG